MATNKKIKLSFEIDGVKESAQNISELENNLKGMNDAIKDVPLGSDKFKELSSAIAQTSSEMKGLELSMEGLDAEGKASAFGSFAAGMAETATGAVALSGALGITNESSEAMVETLVSGMAVAQTFRGGLEGIISAQKLMKASTIGTTAATGGASVAMRILNAVMNMNPIFLLITALITFIALLAIFSAGTNDAAEANKELAASMEANNKLIATQTALRETQLALEISIMANNQKLLDQEAKMLKSKKNLTAADKERLEAIEGEQEALEAAEFNVIKDEAVKKMKDNSSKLMDEFKFVKNAISATDHEDGWNDINYNGAIKKTADLQKEFKKINAEYNKTGNIEAYQKATSNLANKSAKLSREFDGLNLKLGKAEQEEWKNVLEGADNLTASLGEANKNAANLSKILNDKETADSMDDLAETAEDIAEANAKSEAAEKRRNEYIAAQKKLKQDILKIDQALALATIDDSDLAGQEEKALLAREQSLQNELAGIEGNSAKALELKKKVTELAEIEIQKIKDDYSEKNEAKVLADAAISETEQLAKIALAIQGEEMLHQAKLDAKIRATEGTEGGEFEAERLLEQERYALQLTDLTTAKDNELLTEQQYNEMLFLAQEEHSAKMKAVKQSEADADEELQEKKKEMALEATMGLLGGINDLVQAFAGKSDAAQKKAFKVNKAFQIAQATIDTIKGGVSAFTGMVSTIPGPVGIALGAVAAVGVVASGIASIKKIASTKFQGTGGGGAAPSIPKPGGGSGGSAAPVPPSINLFGQPNEGSEGGNEQALGARQQPTVKAVVVESDITNVQNRLNTYQQRSEIG